MNSSHHQCVETLGAELTVAATAEEPIIEAIQWKNVKENPFYLGVQVRLKILYPKHFVYFLLLLIYVVASRTNG